MSSKNTATVVIGGKVTGWKRMTSDMKAQLLALNIADDYFKAKRQAELLDEDLQNKDREIYDLKQQIVELSMTLDDLTAPAEGKRNGKR